MNEYQVFYFNVGWMLEPTIWFTHQEACEAAEHIAKENPFLKQVIVTWSKDGAFPTPFTKIK